MENITAATYKNPEKLTTYCKTIQAAAEGFVSVFYQQTVKAMQDGLDTSKVAGIGKSEKAYHALQQQAYGQALASQDHSGLTNAITRQMSKKGPCEAFFQKPHLPHGKLYDAYNQPKEKESTIAINE